LVEGAVAWYDRSLDRIRAKSISGAASRGIEGATFSGKILLTKRRKAAYRAEASARSLRVLRFNSTH
jgi:hypothetical protein